MAKKKLWNEVRGAYTSDDAGLTQVPMAGASTAKGRDLSRNVDFNSESDAGANQGFSSGMKPPKE